jgi:tetratricopeptide (TPR) repeat protein
MKSTLAFRSPARIAPVMCAVLFAAACAPGSAPGVHPVSVATAPSAPGSPTERAADGPPAERAPQASTRAAGTIEAVPTASAQREALLQRAFDIASLLPADPHAFERARAQALAAKAAIELDMLDRAEAWARRIQGWQRGEVLALIAQRLAADGRADRALALAAEALGVEDADHPWGAEFVAVEVAKVHVALGDDGRAYALLSPESQVALGTIEAARTPTIAEDELDHQADAFDRAIATGHFDLARTGIAGYRAWLERTMTDVARRERALRALDGAIPGLPLDLQVREWCALAELLARRGQGALAEDRLVRAEEARASTQFLPEDIAPVGVLVVRTERLLGHPRRALATLEDLLAEYGRVHEEIVDLRRATSLRALAEQYAALGDIAAALRCYDAAIEEGMRNPNGRPRAEDLCATCVSMAVAGVTPPPDLVRRVTTAQGALADPW